MDEVTTLLQTHAAVLDPSLRRTLVKALILMRNRDQVRGDGPAVPLTLPAPARRADATITFIYYDAQATGMACQ